MNIIVIENKRKKKNFDDLMYGFIEINAIFNIVYCAIMLLKMLNTCVFDQGDVFCSKIYKNNASQSFKIVVIHFLGNSIKLSSNLSYLMFAISRLILISTQKKRPATKKARLLYFAGIFLSSAVLSLFKLFQYELNVYMEIRRDFPFEKRDESYCNSDNHEIKFQCGLFNFFKILNVSLNDIVLVVFNILVDILLLLNFHKHMKNKARYVIDMDHHKAIQNSKKNINRMVFANSLIYIVSHLPEFLATLLLIVHTRKIARFCAFKLSCDLLNEEASCFALISIVCQFYIFLVFNRSFSESFRDLKERFWTCVCCGKRQNKAETSTALNSKREISSLELKNLNNLIGNGLID